MTKDTRVQDKPKYGRRAEVITDSIAKQKIEYEERCFN